MGSAAECCPCGPADVSLLWPQYLAAPAFELESILEKSIDSILPSRIFQACEGTDARFRDGDLSQEGFYKDMKTLATVAPL